MGNRGRTSTAELMVSEGPNGVISDRPDAPYELDDEESLEWKAIVSSMPPNYFARTHYQTLVQLCRHIVAARRIGQMTSAECRKKNFDEVRYERLLGMQVRESNAIMNLSRSMRLTQQSMYDRKMANKHLRPLQHQVKAPWTKDDEAA